MSAPHYEDASVTLHHGDCIEVMRSLPDSSVDAVVTDPPYGLGFMGKAWDDLPPGLDFAVEALRVLKPGGHLLAFGGTRTWHRLAVAVEDAGFEIRDSIAWLYGSGFPKSLDVSKAIDAAAGAKREVVGSKLGRPGYSLAPNTGGNLYEGSFGGTGDPEKEAQITAPSTDAARKWEGWGTALKPAFEPVVVGRKPLVGTVAGNVLAHGTGALNIDASRIGETGGRTVHTSSAGQHRDRWEGNKPTGEVTDNGGRWPANVVLDESQAAELDRQSGTMRARGNVTPTKRSGAFWGNANGGPVGPVDPGEVGGASRFFYVAKAPKRERPNVNGLAHPTVKPLALMRYLVRLVTPPGGVVLEPFAGSGTTIEAAILEGFRCIAIEREAEYLPLIEARLARASVPNPQQTFDFGEIA